MPTNHPWNTTQLRSLASANLDYLPTATSMDPCERKCSNMDSFLCVAVTILEMLSGFVWHVEDHDLHSSNPLYMGADKTGYGMVKVSKFFRMWIWEDHTLVTKLYRVDILGETYLVLNFNCSFRSENNRGSWEQAHPQSRFNWALDWA